MSIFSRGLSRDPWSSSGGYSSSNSGLSGFSGTDVGNPQQIGTPQQVDNNPLLGNPTSAFDQANDNLAKVMGRGKYAPNKPVENNYVGVADQVPVNQEQRAANAKSNNASQMFMRDQPSIYEDANPEYGEPYQSMGEL